MRKIKEVLRLKHQQGLSARQIARVCGMARSTVSEYLSRARGAGISWPLPADVDEATIEAQLFSTKESRNGAEGGANSEARPLPEWAQIHSELQRHKHLTLQLVWEEYKQTHTEGYQYSQFCELYRRWTRKLDLVLRQSHRAGEKLFVDYAGQTVPVVNALTGEVQQASVFVAVLGASSYTYAEATLKADLESWIGSHVRAFEYLGGCPAVLIPDNLKAGVRMPSRYEPDLNPTYQELAMHYGVAVIPARVRRPRDKSVVEVGVQIVERWILAALRKLTFFSLAEVNQAIRELLERLNSRPFRHKPGSRRELFQQLDRPALRALPSERFTFAQWKWSRVSNDYHVALDQHHYSVPNHLVGREVELRYTATVVEVFHKGVRVAAHPRSYHAGATTTVAEHQPEAHRRYLEWTPARLLSWAGHSGPNTAAVVERLLEQAAHHEQGLRSGLGLVRLGQWYDPQRLEAACARALRFNACSYRSIEAMLKAGLDRLEQPEPTPIVPVEHENIRGGGYFEQLQEASHVN